MADGRVQRPFEQALASGVIALGQTDNAEIILGGIVTPGVNARVREWGVVISAAGVVGGGTGDLILSLREEAGNVVLADTITIANAAGGIDTQDLRRLAKGPAFGGGGNPCVNQGARVSILTDYTGVVPTTGPTVVAWAIFQL